MAQCGHLQHSTKSPSSARENVKTLIIGMWDEPGREEGQRAVLPGGAREAHLNLIFLPINIFSRSSHSL